MDRIVLDTGVHMNDKQMLGEIRRRRERGAHLLAQGKRPAAVARELGVSRQSVMRWARTLAEGGLERISQVGQRGGRSRLTDAQLEDLAGILNRGALAAGYATEEWTLPRIGALIEARFDVKLATSSVWRTLRRMDWSAHRPASEASERSESVDARPHSSKDDRR